MITTEYIGFLESLFTSILGMAIVFMSLVFLARKDAFGQKIRSKSIDKTSRSTKKR